MRLFIEMYLDNEAFQDGGTDEAKRAINEALEEMRGKWPQAGGVSAIIRDINGNTVGLAKVTDQIP